MPFSCWENQFYEQSDIDTINELEGNNCIVAAKSFCSGRTNANGEKY
eukprot:gene4151-16066_t